MKTATRLLVLGALATGLFAPGARAQDCSTAQTVTVRQINEIPADRIATLNAGGAALTAADIRTAITPPLNGQTVKFSAVVLSDWRNSGLATPPAGTGVPNRIHVFVRDITARTAGVEGMGIQIVDNRGAAAEVTQFFPGDVIDVCGTVAPFIGTGSNPSVNMQLTPLSITLNATEPPVAAGDALRQPVTVTADQINRVLPNGTSQVNWTNYSSMLGQYVRMESASLIQGVVGTNNRVNMLFGSVGSDARVNSYDLSLRYRNDRTVCPTPIPSTLQCYPNPPYNVRPSSDPFVPPTSGTVTVQGFIVNQGFDFFNVTTPLGAILSITPMEDSDFQPVTGPPVVSAPSFPSSVPGNAAVTITAVAQPGDPARTITGVVLNYQFSTGGSGSVPMTNTGGDTYSGQIPSAPDGAFVTYSVTATDSGGQTTTSTAKTYRVLYNGITDIRHVQETANGNQGGSPFAGVTTSMNIEAVVQEVFLGGAIRFAILQDDPTLGPWSGIWAVVAADATINRGDRVTVTNATVTEFSGLTELENVTFSVTSSGAPYDYKVLNTGVLNGDDSSIQEQHEGMLLRFNNVTITSTNPDAPSNFGEWAFATEGVTANQLRGDDLSEEIPADYNTTALTVGEVREFIQGVWRYANNQYKLVPVRLTDIGNVGTANEPTAPAAGPTAITSAYPNPASGLSRVRYNLATAGTVRLAVYDALGREVAVLVDGQLAASTYVADFDASSLAPGVYVVRLQADGAVHTARVTVAH